MCDEVSRRCFLRKAAVTGAFTLSCRPLDSRAADKISRPDILLIMPDQMRGECLSILGHPVVCTPNMDNLARSGTLFRRAYTTVPSCIPARFALLTSLFPQTSGSVGFAAPPVTTPTLPGLLAAAGYASVLVGRNMHQRPESGTCGYQRQILGSTYVENDEYDEYLRKVAPDTNGIRNLINKLGVTCNHWQANPWPLADEMHPTSWVVRQSQKVVADTPADKPLFLTTSFYAPHPPLFPPRKYFDEYLKKGLPAPFRGEWVNWPSLSTKGDKPGHRVLLEGETLRRAQAGYFGLIEHIDREIAALIADFKARSEKVGRAWVIAIISDHGEMLGDHGYFRKCQPYEGSANIPFIICASPALGWKAGARCHQPVCLEDIMPTLLQAAGVPCPASIDGISLVPVLGGEKSIVREWLHFEHATCYSREQAFHALTDGCFKYIWRPADGTEQLFDLRNDPGEVHNLADDAAARATLEKWHSILVQRLKNRPEDFSDGSKLIAGRQYKALNR